MRAPETQTQATRPAAAEEVSSRAAPKRKNFCERHKQLVASRISYDLCHCTPLGSEVYFDTWIDVRYEIIDIVIWPSVPSEKVPGESAAFFEVWLQVSGSQFTHSWQVTYLECFGVGPDCVNDSVVTDLGITTTPLDEQFIPAESFDRDGKRIPGKGGLVVKVDPGSAYGPNADAALRDRVSEVFGKHPNNVVLPRDQRGR